ncbi:MAG: hypothetical protein MI919_42795 [Holophagales bacterium]|nr:hypothetical protein [Holophagales bacterium]
MLAAQSLLEKAPLLTRDEKLSRFGVETIW